MVNANEYLEKYYPINVICQINESREWTDAPNNQGKSRAEITSLNVTRKRLAGVLDLSDFVNLESLDCYLNQLTNLILPNNDKLKILSCNNNQLKEFDCAKLVKLEKLYCCNNQLTELTLPRSAKLVELDCDNNQLTSLDCTNNPHLEKLYCDHNHLTELILPANNQLREIVVPRNHLTSFNYAVCNPATLTNLVLTDNNLALTNISVFSSLINLVNLATDSGRATNNGNQFYGSLESLKDLTKLKTISLGGNNINGGLEYLPDSLRVFHCQGTGIKEILLLTIKKEDLDQLGWERIFWTRGPNYIDLLRFWRKRNPQLMNNAQTIIELSKYKEDKEMLTTLHQSFSLQTGDFWWSRSKLTLNALFNTNQAFYYWLSEKVRIVAKISEELRSENEQYYQNIELSNSQLHYN